MTREEMAIAAQKFKQDETSTIHAVVTDEMPANLVTDIVNGYTGYKVVKRIDSVTVQIGENCYRFFNANTAATITGCCLMYYNSKKEIFQEQNEYLNDLLWGEV